ncbi:hypothetical protein [Mycobacterium sp. 155]|uniref:hypothetical protein n=1 Tax=Mycobacterium sp. 155 TaxID=1157943 RepID=UPI000370F5BE|nr:hypothetical protein [Mycobacterium sp. 155]
MTTPQRRLELVGDTAETEPSIDPQWQADRVIEQWAPEHQYVGALMWLAAEHATPLLELVPDTAIWRPLTQWAYQLIRALVEDGNDPNPVLILAEAKHRPPSNALDPGHDPTEHRIRQLSLYLFDAYSQAVAPRDCAHRYAREVLDEAYRRAFRTGGQRMQDLAEAGADRDDLTTQFTAIRDELADLWKRAETAASQERNPT